MIDKYIEKQKILKSLTLKEFISELDERVYESTTKEQEVLEHQIELEQCVYVLLRHAKPTIEDYQSVLNRLENIKNHLRNPDLHNKALERAQE